MRGTTSMSPAFLRGAAEAPEGLLRNSDRPACGTARGNGRKPETTAVLHAYGVGLGVCGERLDWIDDHDLVRPARSDPRRRRENQALRAQVPVAASLEGFCFRRSYVKRSMWRASFLGRGWGGWSRCQMRRARWRLRQRIASRPVLPSARLRAM